MNNQSINERRHQTNKLIEELLEERRAVWKEYGAIAAMQPFRADQPLEKELRRFCQLMIDYVSLGHFGIYQRIGDGSERRRKVIELAERIYPKLTAVTEAAVSFNDKYESLKGESLRKHLAEDLSKLGEELATRFELEDRLVQAMLG